MVIGIQDEILRIYALGLLNGLLADRTTKANILWATDAYSAMGPEYQRDKEIKAPLMTGEHAGIITNRARKALEQQFERTRQHAEVFTPLWVCAKMNDYADEVWFGRPEVFFKDGEPTERVIFPKGKSWRRYVDARRLELTCGEAPYLVSRYDVSTGESVPFERRIGLLDRKLRVVNENATTEDEWLKWTLRAFQSTYGYEFQGDNVLISRVNLLMTFEEYLAARWQRMPTKAEYEAITNVVAWNLWQMDGLTAAIPYCKAEDEYRQMSIFDWPGMNESVDAVNTQPRCRIMNWPGGRSVAYKDLPIRGKHGMKFDFIIGNPPYQDEAPGESTSDKPIYHLFMSESYKVSDKVLLITPGRYLFNAGGTPKSWNKSMLEDEHFKVIEYEQNAAKVFDRVTFTGGVAIGYYDKTRKFSPIGVFVPWQELNAIRDSVVSRSDFAPFSSIVSGRTPYLFTDAFHRENPTAYMRLSMGHDMDISSNAFEALPEIFLTSSVDNTETYRVLGRSESKRTYRWIRKEYARGRDEKSIDNWKVFLPKANGASGMLGEQAARLISKPEIGHPGDIATDTFVVVGPFPNEAAAASANKYMLSKFARVLLGTLKVTQINSRETWANVPLQDFTPASDIDWSKSIPEIDRQLYAKYGLDEAEIAFIESHVKEMS